MPMTACATPSPAWSARPGNGAACIGCATPSRTCRRGSTRWLQRRSAKPSCNRRRGRAPDLAARRRPAQAALAQARRPDGRQRARRAGLHGLPGAAPNQAALTNPLERLNKEVKRRADVVGIFPNEASIIRLIGAVLLEQNDEWLLQHRYMQIEGMAELTPPTIDTEPTKLPPRRPDQWPPQTPPRFTPP